MLGHVAGGTEMSRALFVAVTLALMPEACAKMMGKKQPTVEIDPPPPPPPPVTGATTPPIWHPPEGPSTASTTTSASTSATTASPPPASPELVKARAASDAKDFKKVRELLEKRVRKGKCLPEESQLVFKACTALKDNACAAAVRAKHPDDITDG
jgi:hypothetical protein